MQNLLDKRKYVYLEPLKGINIVEIYSHDDKLIDRRVDSFYGFKVNDEHRMSQHIHSKKKQAMKI